MQINQIMINDFLRDKVSAEEIADDFLRQAFRQIEDPAEAITEASARARSFIHALAEDARRRLTPSKVITEAKFWQIERSIASHRVPLYCDLSLYIDRVIKRLGLN